VMIAAVKATEVALAGGTPVAATSWLLVLVAGAALFLLLGLATYRHLVEE
jgi:hypothetical protein